MLPIKINGESINIPQQWEEITLKQYRLMEYHAKDLNAARMISILADIDYDVLINFDCSQFDEKVLTHLDFIGSVPKFVEHDSTGKLITPVPKEVTIGEKSYKVPTDVRVAGWFPRTMMKNLINDGIKHNLSVAQLYSPAITYIMQYIMDGKCDDKRYEEIQMLVDKIPYKDAAPIGDFFLQTYVKR